MVAWMFILSLLVYLLVLGVLAYCLFKEFEL